jgi:hypothetical protein
LVICRALPPFASMIHKLSPPARSEVNAIDLPSGE